MHLEVQKLQPLTTNLSRSMIVEVILTFAHLSSHYHLFLTTKTQVYPTNRDLHNSNRSLLDFNPLIWYLPLANLLRLYSWLAFLVIY